MKKNTMTEEYMESLGIKKICKICEVDVTSIPSYIVWHCKSCGSHSSLDNECVYCGNNEWEMGNETEKKDQMS